MWEIPPVPSLFYMENKTNKTIDKIKTVWNKKEWLDLFPVTITLKGGNVVQSASGIDLKQNTQSLHQFYLA